MSSIPNAKMKHAQVHEDAPPSAPEKVGPDSFTDRARDLADEALGVVKDNPKTVAAIGAAMLAGAAALIGGPAIAKAVKGDGPKKPAARKAPAKKLSAKKGVSRKVAATP